MRLRIFAFSAQIKRFRRTEATLTANNTPTSNCKFDFLITTMGGARGQELGVQIEEPFSIIAIENIFESTQEWIILVFLLLLYL